MGTLDGAIIKKVLLDIVSLYANSGPGSLQTVSVLSEAKIRLEKLAGHLSLDLEQAILTYWQDLFRTGHLSWGYNLGNPDAPFFHLTEQGRTTLKNLSRDPANPDGYFEHIRSMGKINNIAELYLAEALRAYSADCYKAAAVMLGASMESVVLELRDELVARMESKGLHAPSKMESWQLKAVLEAIRHELELQKRAFSNQLWERIESYWSAFTAQLRITRNDAGHPSSIAPVTPDTTHASFLIYPEIIKLVVDIKAQIGTGLP